MAVCPFYTVLLLCPLTVVFQACTLPFTEVTDAVASMPLAVALVPFEILNLQKKKKITLCPLHGTKKQPKASVLHIFL